MLFSSAAGPLTNLGVFVIAIGSRLHPSWSVLRSRLLLNLFSVFILFSGAASVLSAQPVQPSPKFIVTVITDTTTGTANNCTDQSVAGAAPGMLCSLRDAIAAANAIAAGSNVTIIFDQTIFATAQTILLSNGQLELSKNTAITGTTTGDGLAEKSLVTVNGNNASTIFVVDSGVTASLNSLIISGGKQITPGVGYSGGIINKGTLAVNSCTLTGNVADLTNGTGGAIYSTGTGTLTISGSTISGNTASAAGGGLFNNGTAIVSNTTIDGNTSTGGFAGGGGIDNQGTLTLINSTISNNSATQSHGGAIYNFGTLTMDNTTIARNAAMFSNSLGGGIYNTPNHTVTMRNSTIAGNSVNGQGTGNGGGIYNYGTVTATNSILSGNIQPIANDDCAGSGVCPVNGDNGNLIGGTVALSSLGNYGGSTQTMVPLSGSTALNAGTYVAGELTMDQRSAPRPSTAGAVIDAGTVQMTGTPSITSVNPSSGSFAGGTTVTISGTAFTGATTVNFGTISATTFTVESDTSITVTAPAAASIGKVDIVVNSAQGSSGLLGTSVVDQFTYLVTTPTISFAVPNHVYGDAPFTVSASSESTGAITYLVVSGPATVSGSTVTLTGVGTVVLSASQAASGNFAAATASTSFAVDADPPSLSFVPIVSKTLGNPPFTISATSASSGAVTYAVVSGPATISGSTVTLTGNGTVVLSASQAASGNYATATATTSFTVTAASPVVPTMSFAPIPAQMFGTAPFTVSATSASSGAVSYAVVSGPATISGSTVTLTGTGTVVLSAGQVASGNYAAATATTSFTVAAGFSLSSGTGTGTGTATVAPGAAATFTLTLSPGGAATYPDALTLSATGLPTGATAIFSPATIPAGSAATPVTLTIQTSNNQTSRNERPFSGGPLAPLALGFFLLPLAGMKSVRRRMRQMPCLTVALAIIVLSLSSVLGLSGCGGSDAANQTAKSYTVAVIATDVTTGAHSTANVTLNVK
jgi:hypothetical protein